MAACPPKSAAHRKGTAAIEAIRAELPRPILSHHDRIRVRGRLSCQPVRHWVCSSCHISLASGTRRQLTLLNDLTICDNCGSYVYLLPEEGGQPLDLANMPPPLPKVKKTVAASEAIESQPAKAKKTSKAKAPTPPKTSSKPAPQKRTVRKSPTPSSDEPAPPAAKKKSAAKKKAPPKATVD